MTRGHRPLAAWRARVACGLLVCCRGVDALGSQRVTKDSSHTDQEANQGVLNLLYAPREGGELVNARGAHYTTKFHTQEHDIFMRYMPQHDLVVCGCGKCGSSTMYSYIYSQVFDTRWPYHDRPYPQNISSERWNGTWEMVHDTTQQMIIMDHAYSFALIRDPKERLVSAWMSKVACRSDVYHVDKKDRAFLVPKLREIQGKSPNMDCLSLEDFAAALHHIHQLGRARYLDRHFLPQNLGCFHRYPAMHWSKVIEIKEPTVFSELVHRIKGPAANYTSPPHTHASAGQVQITPRALQLLDAVTADEYKMLGPFLKRPSTVKEGTYSLRS